MSSVIVAGSRDITDRDTIYNAIESSSFEVTEIVSGGCRGPDSIGEEWAEENDVPVKLFEANWSNGRSAGPKRNKKMAKYADALILIWDGESPGSRDMLTRALNTRMPIYLESVGYEGVFRNELTEEELMRRYPELKRISDVWVRSETVTALLEGHPDYIWEVASSRTGKYHPPDERGDHGQWLHVKRMFYAYEEMVRSLEEQGEVSARQVELGKAAVFFHDLFKNGIPPGALKKAHNNHDTLAAEYVRNFTGLPEEVARLCDIHNGAWGNGTQPETPHEHVFHQADMIVSRNHVNTGVYQPADELREISDQLIDIGEV